MALIGEMKYLQIGSNTYEIPTSELPIASSSTLGGIKVGTNLSIDSSTGVLSVTGIPTKISDITTYDNFGIGYIDCRSSDRFIFVNNVKFGSSGDSDYSSPFLLMFQNGSARSGTVTIPGSGNFRFYNINTNQLLNYYTSVNYTNLQYGKLYIAYMSDNRLVIKSIAEITDIPTISITRNLTSGTKSATINISGTDYDIYSVTNTDQNVTQTAVQTSISAEHRLLLSNSTNDTTQTSGVFKAGKLTYNSLNSRLALYANASYTGKLRIYYRDGFYFDLQPSGYYGDSSNYNAIVAFASGNGQDVVLSGIKAPSNDNEATNKLYVDTRSLPTGGTAGQVLKKTSSTNYDVEWGAVDALPVVTSSDNNKVLMVVNGAWAAASLPIYNGGVS